MHDLNIVHRDLKTENMLFCKNKQFIKLIDFGLSQFCTNDKPELHETKGTLYYLAPEVIKGSYDKRCDLWSMGVIAYRLLSGQFPFFGTDDMDLDEKILECDYDFSGAEWFNIS